MAPLPRLVASIGVAALGYAIWYRVAVGPCCPGMWHGTAPPVLMGLFGFWTFRALGRAFGRSGD